MRFSLFPFVVLVIGLVTAEECDDVIRCVSRAMDTYTSGKPFTTCTEGIRSSIDEVKTCALDMIDGKIKLDGCLTAQFGNITASSPFARSIARKFTETVAGILCTGCPWVPEAMTCITAFMRELTDLDYCNILARFEVEDDILRCMRYPLRNSDACRLIKDDFRKLMQSGIVLQTVATSEACKRQTERPTGKRALSEDLINFFNRIQ